MKYFFLVMIIAASSFAANNSNSSDQMEQLIRLEAAVQLEQASREGNLNGEMLDVAIDLLGDENLFVRSLA